MSDGAGLRPTIGLTPASDRIGAFYATLDLGYKTPRQTIDFGRPEWVSEEFPSDKSFADGVERLARLGQENPDDTGLKAAVSQILKDDPRVFIPLMFAFRQSRFTNADLIQMMFDQARLDDLTYYRSIESSDDAFREAARRARTNKRWLPIVVGLPPDLEQLANFKKAVSSYLTRPAEGWPRWKSRIKTDSTACDRVAAYVVDNLGFRRLLEIKAVESVIKINLQTVNVEEVKHQVGEYAMDRVRTHLKSTGFSEWEVEQGQRRYHTIDTLARNLPTSTLRYVTEVLWKENKRFDFVLVNRLGLRCAIEVNYFTTSGSKIGEVVDHFIELNKDPARFFHLFYVTDGPGWFSYAKDVQRMFDEESSRNTARRVQDRFLLNLHQFEPELASAAERMLAESG